MVLSHTHHTFAAFELAKGAQIQIEVVALNKISAEFVLL